MTPQDIEAYHIAHGLFLAVPLFLIAAGVAIYLLVRHRRRRRARAELLAAHPEMDRDVFAENSPFQQKHRELLKIKRSRKHLEQAIAQVPNSAFDKAPIHADWTFKDIVAHLTAWEARLLGWMEEAATGQRPQIPEAGRAWDDLDELNAQTQTESRKMHNAKILEMSNSVHAKLVRAIQSLPTDPEDDFWSLWEGGKPTWALIAANTYEHVDHHLAPVLAWIDAQASSTNSDSRLHT